MNLYIFKPRLIGSEGYGTTLEIQAENLDVANHHLNILVRDSSRWDYIKKNNSEEEEDGS